MTTVIWVLVALLIIVPVFAWFVARNYFSNQAPSDKKPDVKDESERIKELERLRTALYTNITHEFRTPLTVISGMADMIVEDPAQSAHAVEMIKRNSRSLLTLINQMLDLSKLDSGAMETHFIQGDIVSYITYIVESLSSFADQQDVILECIHEANEFEMDHDPEKTMQILSNLISNGIKFTPKDGTVEVWTKVLTRDGGQAFQITVRDSGIGIGVEHVPHIFDRFYRIEDTALKTSKGTGIGLALTKDLVDLLGGEIEVQSATGKGATFFVTLPVTRNAPKETYSVSREDIQMASDTYSSGRFAEADENIHAEPHLNSNRPTVLVIEDNEDVATYIESCLKRDYVVEYAPDGEAGIEMATEIVPDLVVTDVMMPKKDGFEVCKTLKADERTSHIPIVLLTARADHESKIEGLGTGADAYLSKPFDKEELLVRLKKLLELREVLRERYSAGIVTSGRGDTPPSKEDLFIQKLNNTILDNLDDTEFGILQLTRAMALSRAQLHNKIKALTGRSTGLYMRYVRLTKAREFLKTKPDLNISEIAYDVGFKDPAYFTRCFTDEYGMPPSEAR